jgi:hypothetical protein
MFHNLPFREPTEDTLLHRVMFSRPATGLGLVSRVTPVHTAMRNVWPFKLAVAASI